MGLQKPRTLERKDAWDGNPLTWSHRHPVGRAVSLGIGVAALTTAVRLGGARNRLLWTCAVAPDVALLIGIRSAPTWQTLPSYAIGPYNTLHAPALPAALLGAGAVARHRQTTVAALAWLAHIAVDRAWGYGPRAPDGTVS